MPELSRPALFIDNHSHLQDSHRLIRSARNGASRPPPRIAGRAVRPAVAARPARLPTYCHGIAGGIDDDACTDRTHHAGRLDRASRAGAAAGRSALLLRPRRGRPAARLRRAVRARAPLRRGPAAARGGGRHRADPVPFGHRLRGGAAGLLLRGGDRRAGQPAGRVAGTARAAQARGHHARLPALGGPDPHRHRTRLRQRPARFRGRTWPRYPAPRHAGRRGGGLGPAGAHAGVDRLPAIHLRLHRQPEGRGEPAWRAAAQPAVPRPPDPAARPRPRRHRRRQLAAAVPRSRADHGDPAAAGLRQPRGLHGADGLRRRPAALARNRHRRACHRAALPQLRAAPVRRRSAERRAGAPCRHRPVVGAMPDARGGAGAAQPDRSVPGRLRRSRHAARGDPACLWAGRGDAAGVGQRRRCAAAPHRRRNGPARTGARRGAPGCRAHARRRQAPLRQQRPRVRRPGCPHRRSAHVRHAARGRGRRDLDQRPLHRRRLLEQGRTEPRNLHGRPPPGPKTDATCAPATWAFSTAATCS